MLSNEIIKNIASRSISSLLGVAAVAFVSTSASAGIIVNDLQVTVEETGGSTWQASPNGTPNPDGTTTYVGQQTTSGWTFGWNINTNPDPIVLSNLTFQNLTAFTQTYTITVDNVVPAIAGSTIMGGSISGGATDNNANGVTVTSGPNGAVYFGRIDGVNLASTALLDPYSNSAAFGSLVIGPDSFGLPGLTTPGPAVATSIGIQLQFTLASMDSISLTSFFQVEPVPAPAGLAVLGLAGLVGCGRRRR